jgi:hypothetical protein
MANEETKEIDILKTATNSPLIGHQAKPTVLDSTTKLDIDTTKSLVDNIIEAGLSNTLDVGALESFTQISNARDQVYQLIDTMCTDSAVSSIVRTYSEDVCETADNGHIVWCESSDPQIAKFVNYLLNVMNVDKKIFSWVYCLIKYGDVYLRLYRDSDYADPMFKQANKDKVRTALNENLQDEVTERALNEAVNLAIHPANDRYSYYVEMIADPGTMFELTKFGQTFGYIEVPNQNQTINQASFANATTGLMGGSNANAFNFKYGTSDVNIYQADDFVHACLEDNVSRFPETVDLFYDEQQKLGEKGIDPRPYTYTVKRGKSLLYDAYKIWREKALLESAVLLSRITRSGIVRKVGVEVGDMSKEQVQLTLRRVKELFEQKSAYNTDKAFSEYNNPGAVENFIYYATHNGQGAITVESVGGDFDPKQLTDLDWWNNKFYSSFGIPKQYFGWTDDGAGFNGGSSLTILSSVYSKGVKRVQNCILQAITDAINLFLLDRGCKSFLNNFVLKMRAPVTQEEVSYRENFTNKVSAISNVNGLFTDIENKARRLGILKSLVASLELGGDIISEIQKEIEAAEEEAAKAAAEAETADLGEGDLGVEESAAGGDEELSLDAMPDSEITEESFIGFTSNGGGTVLTEDQFLFEDDDLPSPEEASPEKDFTQNV